MFNSVSGFDNVLFGEFRRFQREVEELFNGRGWPGELRALPRTTFPAIDVTTAPEKVEIKLSAPGIDPKALDISIQQNVLTIVGQRTAAERTAEVDAKATPPEKTTLRQERFSGDFKRVLALPEDVDSERVSASYVDGIVHITVPRREAPKARRIEIH